VAGDVLEEGDVMRWSAELVAQLQVEDRDVLVRVRQIERQDDGTVQLRLEPADALPDWKVAS
jgi:hypothetical protein